MGTLAISSAYRGADYVLRLARPMTPIERQALREKHTAHGRYGKGTTSCDICPGYYPCDVIRLLDATEPQCDHVIREKHRRVFQNIAGSWIPAGIDGDETWLEFTYCPKCGEKL